MRTVPLLPVPLLLALTGCSLPLAVPVTLSPVAGAALRGGVHGGQQPVVGAHVYLFSAGLGGSGGDGLAASSANASQSLLNPDLTRHMDATGGYVLSGNDGGFTVTGDYVCTPGTQVYALALGGDSGNGPNPAISLLAVLGQCGTDQNFLAAAPFLTINEVSTVAAAYSLAGFATDPVHISSSGSLLAKAGMANAAANAANLADLATGAARLATPGGNGTVPQSKINTLADILAGCVNSSGSSSQACSMLFANALSAGATGSAPADTAAALINIAHHPGANVAALNALYATVAATAPFQPALASPPSDLTLAIRFATGTGSNSSIALDSAGNVWAADRSNNRILKFSSTGNALSGAAGFGAGYVTQPFQVAIDTADNVWVSNQGADSVAELSSSGSVLSGANGFRGGGLGSPAGIAFDPAGNLWVIDAPGAGSASLSELSSSGVALSPGISASNSTGGYHLPSVTASLFAFDSGGTGWAPTGNGNAVAFSNYLQADPTGAPTSGYALYPVAGAGNPLYGSALDSLGNVWIAGGASESLFELSSAGAAVSGTGGFQGGGLSNPQRLAIDGSNHIWVADDDSLVSEFSSAGAALSGPGGFNGSGSGNPGCAVADIAIDGSGNVWEAAGSVLCKVVGAATPVVTPLAAGVRYNTLATRP